MKTYQEFIQEALWGKLVKAAARQVVKTKALKKAAAKNTSGKVFFMKPAPAKLKVKTPTKNITGFRSGGHNRGDNFDPMKGSHYHYKPGTPGILGKKAGIAPRTTSYTAPGHLTSAPGKKAQSDATVFTDRMTAAAMRHQRVYAQDWNTAKKYTKQEMKRGAWKNYTDLKTGEKKRLPVEARPKRGLTPIEVWDSYPKGVEIRPGKFTKGGERMTHAGSPVVDIQTRPSASKHALPLYKQQRKEITQNIKTMLGKESDRAQLNKELGIKEKELKSRFRKNTGSYRNVGVGRRESLGGKTGSYRNVGVVRIESL